MKSSIDGLANLIENELKDWEANVVHKAVNDGLEETAKMAEQELKKGGPYRERTGKYTRDWSHEERYSRASAITGLKGFSVYNKKHYQLTHLLEKGHQLKRGGRKIGDVKAYKHIATVNDLVADVAIQKIRRKVGGGA